MSMPEITEKPRGRPGRKPKHDWTDKRDVCYKLYVEEKKSMVEVREYFANRLGVDLSEVPQPREFTRQFKRWEFPVRLKRLHFSPEEEAVLVTRLRQLWETGCDVKQIEESLAADGWELETWRIRNLRKKHGLLLRAGNAYDASQSNLNGKRIREDDPPNVEQSEVGGVTNDFNAYNTPDVTAAQQQSIPQNLPNQIESMVELQPEEAARRMQRLIDIGANSEELLQKKKRRRRIRGYGHLGPDEPGPPRYKSETSLDECKAILKVDNDLYVQIRQQYTDICNDMGIRKKTECQPGVWDTSKDRLIRDSPHLSSILHPLQPDLELRANALECVCADVTKRIRVVDGTITLKSANVRLGINPAESKELRHHFYMILAEDNFQTKLLCGDEHWEELKMKLYETSEIVQRIHQTPMDTMRTKCYNMLLRDAMKRYSDDRVKNNPNLKQYTDQGYGTRPGPGPARRMTNGRSTERHGSGEIGRSVSTTTLEPDLQSTQFDIIPQAQLPATTVDLDPALFADIAAHATKESAV